MKKKLVVVGNGMAPGRMLEHLLEGSPDSFDITIFNAEPRVNYNRLMLSPVLSGEKTYQDIITHDDGWYEKHGITLHKSSKVTKIDRVKRRVASENGIEADYDKLVLATGSNPIVIPIPGYNLRGVLTYRDLDDVNAMLEASKSKKNAVVIGGGLLGLEAAAGLKEQGMSVVVIHLANTLMERQLDESAGHLLQETLEKRGIDVITQANTSQILGEEGHVSGVELENGMRIDADIVCMAVGVRPNVALAQEIGLAVNHGILVGDDMSTNDENIFALGECAEHNGTCYGLVAPLYEMADVLADTLLGGSSLYSGSQTATKLKVTGIDLYSAGNFAMDEDTQDIILRDTMAGVYKRLVLKNNLIIGAVLYGEISDGPWFFDLLKCKTDISDIRETLIFGHSFQGTAVLDRIATVQALQDDSDICGSY